MWVQWTMWGWNVHVCTGNMGRLWSDSYWPICICVHSGWKWLWYDYDTWVLDPAWVMLNQQYFIVIVQNATVFTERVNTSCTTVSTPNVLITPSQTVTMMDESSSREKYPWTVWVVLSLVGLLLFLAIVAVVGIIFFVHKKTKKQLAEFVKSRSATFFTLLLWV